MIVTDLKILKKVSEPHKGTAEDRTLLVKELEKELKGSKRNGVGLSAIQIGNPLRVAIIRTDLLHLDLFNAKIVEGSGMFIHEREGCLSLPDQWINTERMNKVTIVNGDDKLYELKGFEAVVAQHEIDHWDGILITDRKIK